MLGLDIDGQFLLAEHFAGGGADGGDDHFAEGVAKLWFQTKLLGHAEQVRDLMSAGDDQHIALARADRADVVLQRLGVLRQVPLIDADVDDLRAAGFETSDEALVGDAVFLQADGLVVDHNAAVYGGQQITPGVRLWDAMRWFNANFGHRRDRFRAAADRRHVGQGMQKSLTRDVLLDRLEQMPKADAGEKDHRVDLAGDEAIGKIDRVAILLNRHLAHARADEGLAAEFFDQPADFDGVATFESGDAEVGEVGSAAGHAWGEYVCSN